MNLHQLNTEARAGHVDELNLIAIEGGDYLLEARVKGHPHPCPIPAVNACACTRWKMRASCCKPFPCSR